MRNRGRIALCGVGALVLISAISAFRTDAEEPVGTKEGGVSTFDEALATLPIALPKPERFARRAAVRMRGAIVCEAAGYVGRPFDRPTDGHFKYAFCEPRLAAS